MRVRGLVSLAAEAVMAVTLTACGSNAAGSAAAPARAPDPAAAPARAPDPAADQFKSVRSYATVAPPTRVRVPAIDLVTPPLEQLGRMAKDKSIALPRDPLRAGWFKDGPRPGQPGPAVIIGHVDMSHAPAVFFRLREMQPGQVVYVDRADGSTEKFTVTKVRQVAKTDFPTQDVYAPDLQSSLRLITCGGQFDHDAHNYLDNVIVFASPA
ncbi:MAG TPA: class F sortase [Mycobacteriales bacterium]|jgi:LPXTG-site transpeptidase (sortase) family protein